MKDKAFYKELYKPSAFILIPFALQIRGMDWISWIDGVAVCFATAFWLFIMGVFNELKKEIEFDYGIFSIGAVIPSTLILIATLHQIRAMDWNSWLNGIAMGILFLVWGLYFLITRLKSKEEE